jgi:hypothetical protein
MNSTQIQTTFTPIIGFIAGILAAKFAWFDSATWTAILMGVVGLGATIWGALATRNNAVISQAAALPEVQSIKLEPSASASTVAATPSNVTK